MSKKALQEWLGELLDLEEFFLKAIHEAEEVLWNGSPYEKYQAEKNLKNFRRDFVDTRERIDTLRRQIRKMERPQKGTLRNRESSASAKAKAEQAKAFAAMRGIPRA